MCQLLLCSQTVERQYLDKKYLVWLFSGENIKYIKVSKNFHCGSWILEGHFGTIRKETDQVGNSLNIGFIFKILKVLDS